MFIATLAECSGVNASQGREFEIGGMDRRKYRREETAALLVA
jgi:hypothetical protein